MLFSRAVGVEYPTGHLLCEFEVGLSLKIALTRGYKKTVKNLKRTPVQLELRRVELGCIRHPRQATQAVTVARVRQRNAIQDGAKGSWVGEMVLASGYRNGGRPF